MHTVVDSAQPAPLSNFVVWLARIQVFVQGLVPGGAAETSAKVNVGDEIIGINNVLVRDLGLGIHARV